MIELRDFDDSATADELVVTGARHVHLERMDHDTAALIVSDVDGHSVHVTISAQDGPSLHMTAERDP